MFRKLRQTLHDDSALIEVTEELIKQLIEFDQFINSWDGNPNNSSRFYFHNLKTTNNMLDKPIFQEFLNMEEHFIDVSKRITLQEKIKQVTHYEQ